jgi:Ca2+-binding RTX toxin-like protein
MPAFPQTIGLADLDGSNGFHLVGGAGVGGFGYSIAVLADVNGDGFDDLAINSSGPGDIWLGRQGPFAPSTTVTNGFPFEDSTAELPDNVTEHDSWIVAIGDVNGDGFADFDHHAFFVTETYYEYEYGDTWTETIFHDYATIQYGGSGGATTGKRFGDSGLEGVDVSWLSALGDVNGDGFDDVAVYVDVDHGGARPPKVVFGSATGLPENADNSGAPSLTFTVWAGEITGGGDFNGDGIADLVVESRNSSGGDGYVIFGRSDLGAGTFDHASLDGTNGFKLPEAMDARSVGDVNGDGFDDIVVALWRRAADDPYYIVYGRADSPATIDPAAVDGSDGFRIDNAGTRSVNRAGDINADGRDDLIIGTDYVIFGRADVGAEGLDASSVDGDVGFQIVTTGIDTSGWNALNLQAAGDVNGDGVDDLVVGTSSVNAVHVILGHAATAVNWLGTSARENHGGSQENDVLNGAGGNDYLRGLGGDDLLIGGAGGDILDGGAGNDTVGFGATVNAVTVDLAAGASVGTGLGNDTLISIENAIGGGGADNLGGTDGDNRLDGGLGADRMVGRLANDTYVVDNAGDVVVETRNQGTDTVETTLAAYALGADVENLLHVGGGDFAGTGNTLANLLVGGAGNDDLNGGRGVDTMRGGFGDDTYLVDHPGDIVDETGGSGIDTIVATIGYTLGADFENLVLRGSAAISGTGNDLANVITGNGADNTLIGLGGDDTLTGRDGNDKVLGGDGNDSLSGGITQWGDSDQLRGGLGDDTYLIFDVNDVASEAGGGGIDTVKLSAVGSFTLGSGLENLVALHYLGGALTGNSLDNKIIASSSGASDVLNGMRGNDTLSGRGGADTFVFNSGFGHDRITDFATEDKIRFEDGLFADFADVMDHAAQVGNSVVISYNAGNSVTLGSYQLGNLAADDFLFA